MFFGRHSEAAGNRQPAGEPGQATPDAELVRAARRGDKRAFVEIVARHQAMVCGIALGILGDFAASEDAAQEAFLTAWRKFHELREPEKLRSWLGQIARNSALGHLRRKRGHDALDEALALADESPRPDEVAASEEEAALVRDSLAKLPESYRLPLVLFYREGQSVRAVAEALALSEDAVKQRLARGREMLREQMTGLVESVLTRTAPTAVFTMTIAAAIGALATPAAIAGAIFTGTSAAAGTTTSTFSSQVLTAMSTTKTCIITAAVVAAVCIPVGYHVAKDKPSADEGTAVTRAEAQAKTGGQTPPAFENSAIFAEWRKLHEIHGTSVESMPLLYEAIAAIKDQFRRRAFRAALIAEWVQVDAAGGFEFFLGQRDATQRNLFFNEWMARDAQAAVNALLAGGAGWEQMARDALVEIARKVPSRLAEIAQRLPKPNNNFWDTKVRDAFAVAAEGGLAAARKAAEALVGENREQALAGVALAWAKSDFNAAIAWAKTLPAGIDRDEIIRGALFGKAANDPVSALDQIGIVPPGGRQNYFATTTGARVLKEAAKADYDGTVAWIAAHPGRLGQEDMMGIAQAVTERLNADPVAFLNRHAADNTLAAIMPAINSALLNEGGGQRAAVWEWLKTQPESGGIQEMRRQVLHSAGYQDPMLAMRLVAELPQTAESNEQMRSLAGSIFNGGSLLYRFDKLIEQAPEQMRQPLIENAFNYLREDTMSDPSAWVSRIALLPESLRGQASLKLAQAWASQSPEEAVGWVTSMPSGPTKNDAFGSAISSWAAKDTQAAAQFVSALPGGIERDLGAGSLAIAFAEKNPREALDWVMSIEDTTQRMRAAAQAFQNIALSDPVSARQWLEGAPLPPEVKTQLQSQLEQRRTAAPQAVALPP